MTRSIVLYLALALLFSASGRAQPTIPDNIDAILARSTVVANTWSVLIESADGSTIYYQRNPTTGLAPASNTKLFTSSAAFGLLGTNHFFETRTYGNGAITSGTLTGDLNLVSEHDITWSADVLSNPRAALDLIASQLKAGGLTNITGNIQCYGACFYNLSADDAANHDAPNQLPYNASAATNFLAALQAQGITVGGVAMGKTGFSPPGTLLNTYRSTNLTYNGQPLRLDIASIPMLKNSENVMADALLRHIGYKISGVDSFAAGAALVLPWLHSVGVNTNGSVMLDGSGLSHSDRFSASQIVTLVHYMLGTFSSYGQALPIGCVDGTLASRFCGTDGSGHVHGKTGSLSISIALSGFLDNPYDSRRYLFSFIANNQSGIDQTDTRQAMDDATVLMCARGVPISPKLLYVRNNGGKNSITLSWSDEKFVRTGYRVYSSADGVAFGSPINLASNAQSYTDGNLAPGTKRFYRVSVVGTGGESPFSRIYGALAAPTNSQILIVDGYDRWQFQTNDNPHVTNHNFSAVAGRSVSGPAFDTANHGMTTNGTVSLSNYQSVIWMLGEESTQDFTFDTNEQPVVAAYLNGGGNLFVNGSEIGWDLDRTGTGPTTADRNFYHNQLRAAYVADSAATYTFAPVLNGLFTGNSGGSFDNGTGGTYNVAFPDVITPTNGSTSVMAYVGGIGGTAAVQYNGSGGGGKVVNWGFPFETITSASVRDAYMSDVLRSFGMIAPPQLSLPSLTGGGSNVVLNWSTSSGLRYQVQYKVHLTDGVWQSLGSAIVATNTTTSFTDMNSAGTRFYRILLVN